MTGYGRNFADQGWLGLQTDEQYEGLGLGTVDLAVLAEEFGRACVPGPWLVNTWGITLLEAIGGLHRHSQPARADRRDIKDFRVWQRG